MTVADLLACPSPEDYEDMEGMPALPGECIFILCTVINKIAIQMSFLSSFFLSFKGAVLAGHVVLKGAQAGSVIGLATSPAAWLLRGRTEPLWSGTCARFCRRGVGIGAVLGLVAVVGKATQIDKSGIEDRGYRIARSATQIKCDKYSGVGAAGGGVVGLVAGVSMGAAACQGLGLGVLAYIGETAWRKSAAAAAVSGEGDGGSGVSSSSST
ncbi:unnamed protein product [Phaeothamnion confervicola]